MNDSQRRAYSQLYQSRIKIYERKYRRLFQILIKKQISKVIHVLQSSGIDTAIHEARKIHLDADLTHLLVTLYKDVGVYFIQRTTTELKRDVEKSGKFGWNPRWIRDILNYFNTNLLNKAVIPINNTTRQRILEVLSEAQDKGWGTDETVRRLESDDLTRDRAALIARTESAKAAFVGRNLAVKDFTFQMDKEWISAHDNRVRHAHREVDGQIIGEDELFIVDGEQMQGPGDPSASAENVCNCRCVVAFLPARDTRGRLIPKAAQQQSL